jgi:hypothetical protein
LRDTPYSRMERLLVATDASCYRNNHVAVTHVCCRCSARDN